MPKNNFFFALMT